MVLGNRKFNKKSAVTSDVPSKSNINFDRTKFR